MPVYNENVVHVWFDALHQSRQGKASCKCESRVEKVQLFLQRFSYCGCQSCSLQEGTAKSALLLFFKKAKSCLPYVNLISEPLIPEEKTNVSKHISGLVQLVLLDIAGPDPILSAANRQSSS